MASRYRFRLVIDIAVTVVAAIILVAALGDAQNLETWRGLAYMAASAAIMAYTLDHLLPVVGWESVAAAMSLAALLALGHQAAALVAIVPTLMAQFRVKLAPRELVARLGGVVTSVATASVVYQALGGRVGAIFYSNFPGAIAALAAYFSVRAILGLLRDGPPPRSFRGWTATQIMWGCIQGSLIITWAVIVHALMTAWADGILVLAAPGVFSISAIALDNFFSARRRAVDQLANAVGQRDPLYPGHSERVVQYSEAIARELAVNEHDLADIRLGAMLCDIGHNRVRADLALQARPLTEEERNQLAEHVLEGVALISRIPALSHIAAIVRSHHEWYNGLGYPDGLSSAHIPLGARIIAVADAFTAMTSFRPYRRTMAAAEALDVLEANAGGQFCPQAVAALRAHIRKSAGASLSQRPTDRSELGLTVHALRNYVGRAADPVAAVSKPAERDWAFAGLGALSDLTAIMTSSLDIDRVLDVATQIMNGLTGAHCGIALFGSDGSLAQMHGISLPAHTRGRLGDLGLLDDAVVKRAPSSVPLEDIPFPDMREHLKRAGVKRLITVPLLCRGQVIGGAFVRVSSERLYNDAEMSMLMIVASQVAMAVENARLHSETATRLREISEVQALNQWIIENTTTGIIAVDASGVVTLISRPAIQILTRLGFTLPEGTGWSYPDWAAANGLNSHLVQSLRDGQGRDLYSTPMIGLKGTAYFHIHVTVSRDESGRIVGFTDIFHDVTEHRLMEQRILETEKLSALAQLAGGAAHEIRNPLASVRGFVQLMRRRQSDDDGMSEYMNIILSEIDRIDGIIKELLRLAKPAPPALTDLSLRQLLDEICLLTGTGATLHQIDLIKVYPQELPWLRGDGNQLKQVFINIITNAIQATPYGGRIVVDAGSGKGEAWVSISDTGSGIPPERMQRLFEPFFTTKENGTGLGLTVCYGIVRAHGGRIDVESEPTAGTTFTVRLPLTSQNAQAL